MSRMTGKERCHLVVMLLLMAVATPVSANTPHETAFGDTVFFSAPLIAIALLNGDPGFLVVLAMLALLSMITAPAGSSPGIAFLVILAFHLIRAALRSLGHPRRYRIALTIALIAYLALLQGCSTQYSGVVGASFWLKACRNRLADLAHRVEEWRTQRGRLPDNLDVLFDGKQDPTLVCKEYPTDEGKKYRLIRHSNGHDFLIVCCNNGFRSAEIFGTIHRVRGAAEQLDVTFEPQLEDIVELGMSSDCREMFVGTRIPAQKGTPTTPEGKLFDDFYTFIWQAAEALADANSADPKVKEKGLAQLDTCRRELAAFSKHPWVIARNPIWDSRAGFRFQIKPSRFYVNGIVVISFCALVVFLYWRPPAEPQGAHRDPVNS
ncbi:MAG: hypothetical protein GX442_16330 [Candidatus Riflebacteria bacterium]|nr:hypothetical protein [Candidatus Riflebacteria bacterium]